MKDKKENKKHLSRLTGDFDGMQNQYMYSKACMAKATAVISNVLSRTAFSCTDSQVYAESSLQIATTCLQRPRLFAPGVVVLERFYCIYDNTMLQYPL